jgi:hypothetical protein
VTTASYVESRKPRASTRLESVARLFTYRGAQHDDGNVFAVIGRVRQALLEAGQPERAAEFVRRAFASRSYDAVLALSFEYVEVE